MSDIFNYILNQKVDDVVIEVGNRKVLCDTQAALLCCAANVVLVLNGCRLAYRIDSVIELVDKILEYEPELMVIPYEEPLLILRSNYEKVIGMLSESENSDMCFGLVLGYAYVAPDWNMGEHSISYKLKLGDTLSTFLYSFRLPIIKQYTNSIRHKIIDDLTLFQDTLAQYDIKVSTECLVRTTKGYEDFNFDELVCIS